MPFTLPEPPRLILLYFVILTQRLLFAWPTPIPDMSATLCLTPSAMPLKESSLYWNDYQDEGGGGVGVLAFRFFDSFDGHTGISA